MKYFFSLCVVFLLWVNVSGQESSAGQKDAVIMTAKKLMEYKKADIGGLFSASFVKALPKQKITAILEEFNKEYGAYVKIRQKGGTSLEYFYEKALIPGTLHLDKEGKIDGLWFGAPKIFADTYDSVLVELKKLSGSVAVTIRKNGKENILTYNNTLPLAVGSSFKIAVLRALVEKINKGEAMWATVIPLDKNKMAFPSGSLQTWKPGTPMTLASLANLMISRSDNTAADHLLFYCGRENVEKYVPERDHPYLSTLEMVKMKYGMNAEDAMLRDKYLEANSTDKKRLVLAEVDSVTRNDVDPTSDPKDIGTIEWFYTTDELC
ncbi:MAG TPA: serine hydrolase, partial [Candidatus Kapabacteria bacterium]|nr:serine hydrolase [Candidatus Kapabacteria bacterium]